MHEATKQTPSGLRPGFTPLGMWAFSIGTSIGWGSFIVTCNTYLLKSGILGTIFGLLAGAAVIFVITWNLQYMIRSSPDAGGIYTFEKRVGSKDLGFLAFWFVLLTYLAILWANITSVPLFARFFLGDTFQFGFHYHIFGYEVWFGEALLAICAVVLVGLVCTLSVRLSNHIVMIAALIFAAAFTACAVFAIVKHDSGLSYQPMYTEGSGAFAQIVRIAAISPWAFIGFENISHFSEEYSFPLKKVRRILIWSVVITTLLYIFVSLLSISAYPPEYAGWLDYIRDMGNLDGIKAVPAFYAAEHYLGKTGIVVLLLALFSVIMTSLFGNMMALSRLLFAAGRDGDAPKALASLNKRGVPHKAIFAIVAVSAAIPFLGRTAIGWIVDVTTLGATIIYALISHAVFLHARKSKRKTEMRTGVAGMVLMAVFVLLLLIPGLLPFDAMETESYVLFIVWSVLGLVYFHVLIRRDKNRTHGHRFVVWIVLLMLVLFASMMWVSRATESAADNAVQQIFEYHENHPSDGSAEAEAARSEFLQSQAERISRTNTLYTVVSLGLFLLSIGIMMNNYRETKQLDEQLTAVKKRTATDSLTGVRNKYAFSLAKVHLNEHIEQQDAPPFALVVCDINGLKDVNDTSGHQAGDRYICKACKVICEHFKHSQVYRIGGDEFTVLCQGQDYENIDALLSEMNTVNDAHQNIDDVQIAFGMARYENDENTEAVFERADRLMYRHKAALKEETPQSEMHKTTTERSRDLYQFDETLKQAYESSPLSFVYYQNINDHAVPILASDGFCRNTGMSRDHVLDWLQNSLFARMHPDDVGVVSQVSDDFLHKRSPYDIIFRCILSAGSPDIKQDPYVYIHGIGKWQTMPDGTELAVITYANLSATEKSTQEKLELYALMRKDRFYTDPLTGLPNLNYLREFGHEKLDSMRAQGNTPHIIYMDIYSMQSYNNQYGLKEGDRLLCLTADTLVKHFPKALVTRASDDHFVVLTRIDDKKELQKRLYAVNADIRSQANGNTSGMRSGVCPVKGQTTLMEALDYAKQALKRIENDMNREVAFFSSELNEQYMQARYILENFENALEQGWIKVYYHGLYRVTSQKVAAFEALARWEDPQRGIILPSDFIPVLLKYHQLYKLDLYMFEQVCREVIVRDENNLPLVPISVNFSRQDFLHADVVGEMNRLYEKYDLARYVDKSCFIVEITEQDLTLGEQSVIEQLALIRSNGYRLWLDDFGSGYSAINVFSHFEFDLIKYDMELLKHLDEHDGMNRLILEELVSLARKLGIHTLIEGLETDEHLAFVKDIGCELVQGFYYHKPESLETILTDIHNGRQVKPCETPEERDAFNQKWFE